MCFNQADCRWNDGRAKVQGETSFGNKPCRFMSGFSILNPYLNPNPNFILRCDLPRASVFSVARACADEFSVSISLGYALFLASNGLL